LGDIADNQGNPTGMPNRVDFFQSRIQPSGIAQGERPFVQEHMGRPIDGWHNNSAINNWTSNIKTTDELRVATKPKVNYAVPIKSGHSRIAEPSKGYDEVPKNRPDKAWQQGPERWLTTVGVEKGMRQNEVVVLKDEERETTEKYYRGPAVSAAYGFQTYIRPVLEPFMTFYKLTVGEHFGTKGSIAGSNAPSYDVWKKSKLNISRDKNNEVPREPTGWRPEKYAEQGDVAIKKNDKDYTWARSVNGARTNMQTNLVEAQGTMTIRPEVGKDMLIKRLDSETIRQLDHNPYQVKFNPDNAH